MTQPQHDAIVDMTDGYAWMRTLTPQARGWVEAHVTLAQVGIWANDILEVSPRSMSDLVTAMLRAGLKLVPASGKMVIHRAQIDMARWTPCVSPH
jgi:hypothetical protein